jgi:hypothetical protein
MMMMMMMMIIIIIILCSKFAVCGYGGYKISFIALCACMISVVKRGKEMGMI